MSMNDIERETRDNIARAREAAIKKQREQLNEAAAFLDALAEQLHPYQNKQMIADCRALARKLRGEE